MSGKLLILTISDRRGASGRYRVYQFEPLLRQAGFDVRIVPPADKPGGIGRAAARRREEAGLLEQAEWADVIFIQKRLFTTGFISALCRLGKPLVFDFDDAIFSSQAHRRSLLTRLRVRARLEQVLHSSALVLAGNEYLATYAHRHAPRVMVLPTAVDVSRYPVKTHAAGPVTLGWIGSRVTQMHLDALRPALADAARQVPGLRLMVISDRDYILPGTQVVNKRWSEDTEATDLLEADIGLMPLEDSEWTQGKCGLKALQYMAAGLPAVCSAVGANRDIIEHGRSGLLCSADRDWIDSLTKLAADPGLRARLGAGGRRRVEEGYSLTVVGRHMAELLGEIAR